MEILTKRYDEVNPAGPGWLDDWNWKMTERIGEAEEAGDARRVNVLLRCQVSINGFFRRPYWTHGRGPRS